MKQLCTTKSPWEARMHMKHKQNEIVLSFWGKIKQ